MKYCTYIHFDPKRNIPIYVGMGTAARAYGHIKRTHNARLGNTIKKRQEEGFKITPMLIEASSREDAYEMEMLLIDLIGREDMGRGTLFNFTDGGEGTAGFSHKHTDEMRKHFSKKKKQFYADHPEARLKTGEISRQCLSKKCTVDGKTIFPSKNALIAELGHGYAGLRNPNFKWVTND